jgi:hypothetical protein
VPSLGEALFAKYPKAEAKITQGILASVAPTSTSGTTTAQGNDSTGRVGVLDALATALPADAVAIAQGGVFDDPIHSPQFTAGVFDGIVASSSIKGTKTLITDAPAIATGVGSILGADGDVLTNVAATFCTYVTSGTLPVSSVPTYAADLIGGAVKGATPISQFSSVEYANSDLTAGSIAGGALAVGSTKSPTVPVETSVDLQSIEDQFADAIITSESGLFGNATVEKGIAMEIGTLAGDVAKATKGYDVSGGSTPMAEYLAGSLAQYISTVLGQTNQTFITEAYGYIQTDVDAAAGNTATIKTDVHNAILDAGSGDFAVYGAVTVDETPVTNL